MRPKLNDSQSTSPQESIAPTRLSAVDEFLTRHHLWRLAIILTLSPILATLLSLGARKHWMLDLLTCFRVQYVIVLIPIVLLFSWGRRWKLAALPMLVLVYNLVSISPAFIPVTQPPAGNRTFRVVVANVWSKNQKHAKFIEFIEKENPDFFLVMEVNAAWMKSLEVLRSDYPHTVSFSRQDNFGIALFSKLPLVDEEILTLGEHKLPSVFARVQAGGEHFLTILGTHPLPPGSPRQTKWRNEQLVSISELAGSSKGSVLLLGDLNVTPWAPRFADVLQTSKLRDSRRSFGIQATWSTGNPILRIPIDHVLVSENIHIHDRRIGSNVGSDHYPVIVDFSIADE